MQIIKRIDNKMADQTDQIENTYERLQEHIDKLSSSQSSIITKFDILSKNVDELRKILNQFSEKISRFDEILADGRTVNNDVNVLKCRIDELFAIVKEGKEDDSVRSEGVRDVDSCHSGFSGSSRVFIKFTW